MKTCTVLTKQKRQKIQVKQKLERGWKSDELRASKIRAHSSAAEGVCVCVSTGTHTKLRGLNFSNWERRPKQKDWLESPLWRQAEVGWLHKVGVKELWGLYGQRWSKL